MKFDKSKNPFTKKKDKNKEKDNKNNQIVINMDKIKNTEEKKVETKTTKQENKNVLKTISKSKKTPKENIKNINISYYNDKGNKNVNKKKLILLILALIIFIIIAVLIIAYMTEESFRSVVDTNIFHKEITEENLPTIEINSNESYNVFAYSNHIGIIKDNKITIYNSQGKQEKSISIEITTPLISTNGEIITIAEKDGSRIYTISSGNIIWQKDLDGSISRIKVNQNGYVSVILSGTSYKSVIALYNSTGDEVLKSYLSKTKAIDADISSDNKYLSFAEVNTSGTVIQSTIKIISIEKAKETPSDSIIFTYNADTNKLISEIKYQGNKLICMYDNEIRVILNNNEEKSLLDISSNNEKVVFADIDLDSSIFKIKEESLGIISTNTTVEIINTSSESTNLYSIDGVVQKVYSKKDKIAINLGSELYIISSNGWLIKKYESTQDIRDVVMGTGIVGIIYRDKIKIINI